MPSEIGKSPGDPEHTIRTAHRQRTALERGMKDLLACDIGWESSAQCWPMHIGVHSNDITVLAVFVLPAMV